MSIHAHPAHLRESHVGGVDGGALGALRIEAESGATECEVHGEDRFGNAALLLPDRVYLEATGTAEPQLSSLQLSYNATLVHNRGLDNASASTLHVTLSTRRVGTVTLYAGLRNGSFTASTSVTAVPSMATLLPFSPYSISNEQCAASPVASHRPGARPSRPLPTLAGTRRARSSLRSAASRSSRSPLRCSRRASTALRASR